MGGRGIKGLKARVGRECCISRGGNRPSSTVEEYKLEKSEKDTVLVSVGSPEEAGTQQGGQLSFSVIKRERCIKTKIQLYHKLIIGHILQ